MPVLGEIPVDFDVIEREKENIMPLRSGRSALTLSKSIGGKAFNSDAPNVDLIAEQRLEFEKRLLQELEDLDDPLELFLQYITWINNAYPQGGQSKQSGMLEVLERCLMYFRDFGTYKNDPRYVKMWMWYLELFAGSAAERQSLYVYMKRKQIGSSLSLFYESLASFLEQQKQYSQARDILQRGIETNARPLARLRKTLQKFDEVMKDSNIKIQEVASGESILDLNLTSILGRNRVQIQHAGQDTPVVRPSSFKHAIFKDMNEANPDDNLRTEGWDFLDSKHQRNKENEMNKQLLVSGSNVGVLKQTDPTKTSTNRLAIFNDATGRSGPIYKILEIPGRKPEQVDCNFDLIYPGNNEEYCIEERLAMARSVYHKMKSPKRPLSAESNNPQERKRELKKLKLPLREKTAPIVHSLPDGREVEGSPEEMNVQKYQKIERTSILPLKDESNEKHVPSKKTAPNSPTMTLYSKDAINEVYSMFNQNFSIPQPAIDNDDTTSKFAMFENFTQEFTRKHMDDLTETKQELQQEHGEKTPHKDQNPEADAITGKENTTPSYKSKLQEYMTPIQERTEGNFNVNLALHQLNDVTTIGKKNDTMAVYTAESSPFLTQPRSLGDALTPTPLIITNPLSDEIRHAQLQNINPPLSAYETFYQYNQSLKMSALLRKIHTVSKNANKNPIVDFKKTNDLYCIRSQLGEGGYATVYLAESSTGSLKALKVEKPASIWEFYILKQVQQRLDGQPVLDSIINVDSLHCFEDESYLVLNYASQGTILDLINLEKERNGGPLDETLCMYFAVELMKVLECIHDVGIIHGDLKPDNCMVRFEESSQSLSDYKQGVGWDKKGVYLIDFGRSFDLTLVPVGAKFKANWKTDQQDCPEMREGRAWTYEADYYGLAGIIHAMLFGRFIETRALPDQQYALTHSFKRYWRQDIWRPLFDVLLNSSTQERLPITTKMREHRVSLENALEENGHRLRAHVLSLQSDLLKFKK
ncbi:LAME_0C01882g1_1 [Lachancea meyersii CBS 8951]|uniref:LAME_0C01882g1_1 n=1 Tax=Lachancea meyersii CBS 8951 TaxID=1266667 RepID=A0A1G4IZJ3_9SACH|nr:LAME_0C01882g1_1 [Lachancea meyersii CBS 8951]